MPHSAASRGLATCYVLYVWLDSGVQNWNRVGWLHCCAEIGLQCELQRCPCQLCWDPFFLLVVALFLVFSLSYSSSLLFPPALLHQWKEETCVTDISKLRSIIVSLWSISSQKALWSSAVPERRPGLALCTGLNQSGSWWTQVHLSQMLICRAQLWGQRHFTCMWCKITWAGMPSPCCMGFCSWPRDRCDTSGRAKCPFAPPPRSIGSHSCG